MAVVNPAKVSDVPPVTTSDVSVSVVLAEMRSTSVSLAPISDPLPVHPETVKVLPPPLVSVRFAVVIPLNVSTMGPAVSDVDVSVNPELLDAATVPVLPLSNPLPVQPFSVNVWPEPVAVRLATKMPDKLSDMPSVDVSDVLARV